MSRRLTRTLFSLLLAVATAALTPHAFAQRGGGPGGPGGGGMGPGGGMMGGGNRGGDFGHMGGPPPMGGERHGDFGGPTVHGPQLGPPGRWWDDKHLAKTLSLRSDQQRRMDDIFNANKGQLLNLYSNLQREEAHLASMPASDLQDESKVFAGIDRVSQARADLEKENAHILLQIRHELDPDQVAKLDREIASVR